MIEKQHLIPHGISCIGMAIWTLLPDKSEEKAARVAKKLDVFGGKLDL